jgi:vacuolar protein sorting-associated protein VTA1
VRYAKWKAADIAKAIREGRKPIPGPAGSTESEDEVAAELGAIVASQTQTSASSSSPSLHLPSLPSVPPSMYSQPPGAEDWSIVATPRTDINASVDPTHHVRTSSGGSAKSASGRRSPRRKDGARSRTPSPRATTPTKPYSPSQNPTSNPPSPTPRSRNSSPGGSEKKVHFTPSVVGGSVASGSPTSTADIRPPANSSWRATSHVPPPAPPASSSRYQTRRSPSPPGAPAVELTPALIAKAQKHCKFAISSLDYEDAEQAKKELKAALALLGG